HLADAGGCGAVRRAVGSVRFMSRQEHVRKAGHTVAERPVTRRGRYLCFERLAGRRQRDVRVPRTALVAEKLDRSQPRQGNPGRSITPGAHEPRRGGPFGKLAQVGPVASFLVEEGALVGEGGLGDLSELRFARRLVELEKGETSAARSVGEAGQVT